MSGDGRVDRALVDLGFAQEPTEVVDVGKKASTALSGGFKGLDQGYGRAGATMRE